MSCSTSTRSRDALWARHWHGLLPREQEEFVLLFTDVLERAFIARVHRYTDEKVAFIGESTDGGLAEVRSRIIPKSGAAARGQVALDGL